MDFPLDMPLTSSPHHIVYDPGSSTIDQLLHLCHLHNVSSLSSLSSSSSSSSSPTLAAISNTNSIGSSSSSGSSAHQPPHRRPLLMNASSLCSNAHYFNISLFPASGNYSVEDDAIRAEVELKLARWIWQVCPVILFLFGTFGNTAILLTLRHLRLGRTSMHIYLRALALTDLCVLYTGLLRNWVNWTFNEELRTVHLVICKLHTWLVYVSLSVSTWLLVVMTLERTFSTCLPHRVVACCTTRRAIHFIVFLAVFLGLLQAHMLVGLSLKTEDNGRIVCNSVNEEYEYFLHNIWPWVDLCVLSLLPFICLTVGNAIIVWKTCVSLRTAEVMIKSSGSSTKRRRRRASTMTVILLSLSGLFLLTTSPVCVFNLWEQSKSYKEYERTLEGKARVELIWAIVNIAMYCNNTFNFYLYCLTGKKFRFEMVRRFTRTRSESQSNVSAPLLHRFAALNEANRIHAQSTCREVTPLRASSVRFNNPQEV